MGGTGTRTLQVAAKSRLFLVGVGTGEWSGSSGLLTWDCSYSIAPRLGLGLTFTCQAQGAAPR